MATNWAAKIPSIRKAIADKGRPVTLVRRSTTIDADNPLQIATAPEKVSSIAVFVPLGGGLGMSQVKADQFKSCDASCLLAPIDADEVDEFDTLEDGDAEWEIVVSDKLQPGDTPLLYFLGLKRA
jgi:hypothetical protein